MNKKKRLENNRKIFKNAFMWLTGIEGLNNGHYLLVYIKDEDEEDGTRIEYVESIGNNHIRVTDKYDDVLCDFGKVNSTDELIKAMEECFEDDEVVEISLG